MHVEEGVDHAIIDFYALRAEMQGRRPRENVAVEDKNSIRITPSKSRLVPGAIKEGSYCAIRCLNGTTSFPSLSTTISTSPLWCVLPCKQHAVPSATEYATPRCSRAAALATHAWRTGEGANRDVSSLMRSLATASCSLIVIVSVQMC